MNSIRQLLTKLNNKEYRDYLTSTHFWGPVLNWSIPIAAIADTQKDPAFISRNMTIALALYSGVFMRFALRVIPKNRLLFACHFVNECAQLTQLGRYTVYTLGNKSTP